MPLAPTGGPVAARPVAPPPAAAPAAAPVEAGAPSTAGPSPAAAEAVGRAVPPLRPAAPPPAAAPAATPVEAGAPPTAGPPPAAAVASGRTVPPLRPPAPPAAAAPAAAPVEAGAPSTAGPSPAAAPVEAGPPTAAPTRRAVVAAALALLAAPALPRAARAQARALRVVTTTAHLADAVAQVAGVRAAVGSLMGPGVDPHLYRPTRADIARLNGAEIVVVNGLHLEGQLDATLKQLARSRPVVRAAEHLRPARLIADAEYPERFDPHVWMDPLLWAEVVEGLALALAARDPAGRETYAAGAGAARAALADLDARARAAVATVPAPARVLVTAHDAFGYFGRAYGFEVMGIQGLSTESEAGLKHVEELVRQVAERRVPAVFVETSVSDRNVRALVEGAAARGHRLAVGGELYSDALGPPGRYEGTVIGMLDHNVTTIVRALGGDLPAGGLFGRLGAG